MGDLSGTEKTLPVVAGGKRKASFYVSSYSEVEETVNNWFLQVKEGEKRAVPNKMAFPVEDMPEPIKVSDKKTNIEKVVSVKKVTMAKDIVSTNGKTGK